MPRATKPKAPKVKQEAMNKLVKFVSANQNTKKKLNAGQIREMVRLVYIGFQVALPQAGVAEIHEMFANDELVIKTIKAYKIANLEKQLAEAKA